MLGPRTRSLTFLALTFLGAACSASAGNFDINADDGGTSDGSSGSDGSSKDGGKDSSEGDASTHADSSGSDGSTGLTFHGKLVDFQSTASIANGTVTGSGHTATSDVNGNFDLGITPGLPFTATATASGYIKLVGQELSISAYDDFGFLPMISTSTSTLLESVLTGYDSSKGVLIVLVVASGSCGDEGGSTVSVSPAGTVMYFSAGYPDAAATSVTAGEAPSAVIYNITPGVALTLTATKGGCTQTAFPVTQGVLTYTGAMKVEAGNAVTAARVFLQ